MSKIKFYFTEERFDKFVKYILLLILGGFALATVTMTLSHHKDIFNWFEDEPFWSFFDGIVTIFTFAGVLYNIWQRRTEKDEIKIYIVKENQKIPMPISTIRKHITRAEIGGVLRSLYMGQTYTIDYLNSKKYSKNILDIQQGKSNELLINLTDGDTFEYKEIK